MLYKVVFFLCLAIVISCTPQNKQGRKTLIDDLPFHKVKDQHDYAKLIIKAIRSQRYAPILQEFEIGQTEVDKSLLDRMVNSYSQGIGRRDDWEYIDIFDLDSEKGKKHKGFDFVWLDPSGRLGIHIFILPKEDKGKYALEKLEFRSRLDVLDSKAFPGGDIESYKKLPIDWSQF